MCAKDRALIATRDVILTCHPSMGLAPHVVQEILESVQQHNTSAGLTFLMAEQNANLALRNVIRGYQLESGRGVLEASATRSRENEDVS
jgi:branched-chain amino acid transport system ATP-binding protein